MRSTKEEIYLLDDFRPPKGYETEGALLLTYTIDAKAVLATLLALRDIPLKREDDTMMPITDRWRLLHSKGIEDMKWMQEHIGFVCNNGYDKSAAHEMYQYTRCFMSYYTIPLGEKDHSFHPKLYLMKYKRKENAGSAPKVKFRLIIGSMNLVDSHNKEFAASMEIDAYEECELDSQCLDKETEYGRLSGSTADIPVIIKKLLGYDRNNISKYVDNPNLKKVIENLALESYYFRKADLPEVIAFGEDVPEEGVKDKLKQANHIFSPFLSEQFLQDCDAETGKDIHIYTMESELLRLGYERSTGGQEFFVYEINEKDRKDKPLSSHFKAYLSDDEHWVYAGSLNYSKRAFEKNREIVVKLQGVDTQEAYNSLKKQLKEDYVPQNYRKRKVDEADKKSDIRDDFKKFAIKLGQMYEVHFSAEENCTLSLRCVVGGTNGTDELEEDFKKVVNRIRKMGSESCVQMKAVVKICPVDYPDKKETLMEWISGDQKNPVCWKKPAKWAGLNRRKVGQQFMIMFACEYSSKTEIKAEVNIHIAWDKTMTSRLEDDEKAETACQKLAEAQRDRIYYNIVLLLNRKKYTDAVIDKPGKNTDIGEKRAGAGEYASYIRSHIPTMEEIIRKSINENRDISEIVKEYKYKIKEIEDVDNLKKAAKSEEERMEFACLDKKLIENMTEQFEELAEELKFAKQQ